MALWVGQHEICDTAGMRDQIIANAKAIYGSMYAMDIVVGTEEDCKVSADVVVTTPKGLCILMRSESTYLRIAYANLLAMTARLVHSTSLAGVESLADWGYGCFYDASPWIICQLRPPSV
ncbi:hypothetical protein LTR66_004024 [Elasticomyces elasticus]|nr:hypothetical protein LTR28_009932 [Elasticomyces elasticus]KAK4996346.1 hypothetical protein LTR66_004024 [Elasticomyces elasticus]